MFQKITTFLVFIVCILYIFQKWNQAKLKRDIYDSLKVGAGLTNKKSSVFPFLFK